MVVRHLSTNKKIVRGILSNIRCSQVSMGTSKLLNISEQNPYQITLPTHQDFLKFSSINHTHLRKPYGKQLEIGCLALSFSCRLLYTTNSYPHLHILLPTNGLGLLLCLAQEVVAIRPTGAAGGDKAGVSTQGGRVLEQRQGTHAPVFTKFWNSFFEYIYIYF